MPLDSTRQGILDPQLLAKISPLSLRARLAVQGYFAGMHRSPYRGVSVEFVDHRSYTQGDDIRHVDWKVFGRTDKYYIKRYEQESNLSCLLVLDGSESMSFRSAGAVFSKHEYGASIIASLSYLAMRQRDAVGLAVFDTQLTRFHKPSSHRGQWKFIISDLHLPAGRQKTRLLPVLMDLADRLSQRTLIVFVSDLFGDVRETLLGFRRLRFQRHELVVCHVWDPAELTFKFKGPTLFEGLESTGRVFTEPQLLQSRYLEEVRSFIERLSRQCRAMQIEYNLFDTSTPIDRAISAYLATRNARIRQRTSRVLGSR